EHLDFHGTIESYRRAKARLLESVNASAGRRFPRGGVLNADDAGARSIAPYAGAQRVVWFSTRQTDAEIFGSEIQVTNQGTSFKLRVDEVSALVRLKLI